jgi:hypothetical protein
MSVFNVPYFVEDSGPADAFAQLGIDFRTFDAQVVGGQDFQISEPGRDRLIINGTGSTTAGNLVVDLVETVHGVAARSNDGDGGEIRAFSQPALGGTLIGVASLPSGGFGGLISTDPIRSVEITCDFNFDLTCGVYDIQFGNPEAPVPVPAIATTALLIGLASLGVIALRHAGPTG